MGQRASDQYPTPPRLAEAITTRALEMHPRRGTRLRVLEPGAGRHAPFAMAAADRGHVALALELHDLPGPPTPRRPPGFEYWPRADFLSPLPDEDRWDLVITNPPYSLAAEFVQQADRVLAPDGLLVMLLQVGFVGSVGRRGFWELHTPVLRQMVRPRPGFVQSLRSKATRDMREYEVIVWPGWGLEIFLSAIGRTGCTTGYLDCHHPRGWGRAEE